MTRPVAKPGTDDLLGHEQVCRRLWQALDNDRLHHCYLFAGPEGVGKRTVAQRLAMAANCESVGPVLLGPPPPRPCGHCIPCTQIAQGIHPDIIEVERDPSKKVAMIGVEQAREVIRRLSLHRLSAQRRFVIIDPVDIMRREAANALLKTFEEPPQATTFILVTSRPTALLPTVLSRSVRVRFHPVPEESLETWLEARGVEAPRRIARLSAGSPGRALSLLDGEADALSAAREELLLALSGGTADVMAYAEALVKGGKRETYEPRVNRLLQVLEHLLRDAVLVAGGRADALIDADGSVVAERWAKALWPSGITAVEAALADAHSQLAVHITPRLVLGALLTRLQRELGGAAARVDAPPSFEASPHG